METFIKKCSMCKEEKIAPEFYVDHRMKSGLTSYCRDCSQDQRKPYREENKDKINEYSKNYYYTVTKPKRAKK